MIAAGGNVYYLAKLAGIFGLNVQDIGAQQTGMTVEAFQGKAAKRQGGEHGNDRRRHCERRTFPRSAVRLPRDCRRSPTGSRSSTASPARASGWRTSEPDVVVVFYNDHGLNFFLDKLPTFAVGAAAEYQHADEGWGLPISRPYPGDPALSWHLIEQLVADEFDVTMLPGDAGRSRLHHPDGAALAGRRCASGANRSDRDQHRAASAAVAGALLQVRPGHRPRDRRPMRPTSNVLVSAPAGCRISSTASAPGFINKEFDLLCLRQAGERSRGAHALLQPADRRRGRLAGRRAAELDRNARRVDRATSPRFTATTTSRSPTRRRRCWCWKIARRRWRRHIAKQAETGRSADIGREFRFVKETQMTAIRGYIPATGDRSELGVHSLDRFRPRGSGSPSGAALLH